MVGDWDDDSDEESVDMDDDMGESDDEGNKGQRARETDATDSGIMGWLLPGELKYLMGEGVSLAEKEIRELRAKVKEQEMNLFCCVRSLAKKDLKL